MRGKGMILFYFRKFLESHGMGNTFMFLSLLLLFQPCKKILFHKIDQNIYFKYSGMESEADTISEFHLFWLVLTRIDRR